jgi:hypothetical protein
MAHSGTFAEPREANGAISLAYLGALPEHVEVALPLLKQHEVCATFFVSPTNLLKDPRAWQKAARDGHEIASHSLYEVTDNGRLPNWTLQMVADDLAMTQKLIDEVIGRCPASFAMPGRYPQCAEGSYRPTAESLFDFLCAAQGGSQENPKDLPMVSLKAMASKRGFKMSAIDDLTQGSSWTIFAFERFFGEEWPVLDVHEHVVALAASLKAEASVGPIREVGALRFATTHTL